MEKESELDMDDIPKKIQTTEWPPAVLERLDGYAEANSITLEDAQQKFVDYLSDKFAVESWQDEDEDFLLEASEGFVITSRGGGSGFQTENWVGMFVGVDPKARDKRKWMREQALSAYNEDKGKAIAAGLVGVCSKESDGTWQERVSGVSLSSWKASAKDKGAGRISAGVQGAQQDVQRFATELLQAVDSASAEVNAMPDLTLEDRIQKSVAFQRRMAEFKRSK